MEFEPGWLKRQCEAASKEVAKWPKWYRDRMEAYLFGDREELSEKEYRMRREDSQKYGNY